MRKISHKIATFICNKPVRENVLFENALAHKKSPREGVHPRRKSSGRVFRKGKFIPIQGGKK